MESGRVERLYVELTIKERKAKEFATFQEAKALKAGDKVKSGLEAELVAVERIFIKVEEIAMLKQELSRAAGQLDLLLKEKEKEHAKLMKLDGLFKTATAAAKKAMEDAAKLGTLKGEAKADAERLTEFLGGHLVQEELHCYQGVHEPGEVGQEPEGPAEGTRAGVS